MRLLVMIFMFFATFFAHADEYETITHSSGIRYVKKGPLGCQTEIEITPPEGELLIRYGGFYCYSYLQTSKVLENAHSIIQHFNLVDLVASAQYISLSISYSRINHAPLTKFLGKDESWLKDAKSFFIKKYPDRKIRKKQYIEFIREKLLHPEVYLPVIHFMDRYGCVTQLSQYYSDPLPIFESMYDQSVFTGRASPKDEQQGFYGRKLTPDEQIQLPKSALVLNPEGKHYFPTIEGYVFFKLSCNK